MKIVRRCLLKFFLLEFSLAAYYFDKVFTKNTSAKTKDVNKR